MGRYQGKTICRRASIAHSFTLGLNPSILQGICQPCRDLLVADQPFNCEQGPKSTNWICQTCHENGDESIVGERVIKLSGCTFPVQAKKISKEAKEAWRLFATGNPKDCRQSAGGHLAAARKQQAQDHQSPFASRGNAPTRSLMVCLRIGKPQKGGRAPRRDSNMFPNLLRNYQDWSITPNRPPTPPESVGDTQEIVNRSGKPSPVTSHFTQPKDITGLQLPSRSAASSRRPSELSSTIGKQNNRDQEDDDDVTIISTMPRKKRRLHRGLKERPAPPFVARGVVDAHSIKGLKPKSSFHNNEDLLEKWTKIAERRASESANSAENASIDHANPSLAPTQQYHASRGVSPPRQTKDVVEGQLSVQVMQGPSSVAEDALVQPMPPVSAKTERERPRWSLMGLDGSNEELSPMEVDQSMPADAASESKQTPSDQRPVESGPNLPIEDSCKISQNSQRMDGATVETTNDQPKPKRNASAFVHFKPKSAGKEQARALVIEEDPVFNGKSALVRKSLELAATQHFNPPHAYSNSTRESWDWLQTHRENHPMSDPRYIGKQRRSQGKELYATTLEVPTSSSVQDQDNRPKPITDIEDQMWLHDPKAENPLLESQGYAAFQETPPSSFTRTESEPQAVSEPTEATSLSKSETSIRLIPSSDEQMLQPESAQQQLEVAAASPQKPKSMPNDYIEDMLAAANASKASSPVTETSYNIQWSAINAPASKQSTAVIFQRHLSPLPASEKKKKRKRHLKAVEPTSLPRLAPAPSQPAVTEAVHQRSPSDLSYDNIAKSSSKAATKTTAEATSPPAATNQPLESFSNQPISYEKHPPRQPGDNLQPRSNGNMQSEKPDETQTSSVYSPNTANKRANLTGTTEFSPKRGVAGTTQKDESGSTRPVSSHAYPWLNRLKSQSGPGSSRERPSLAVVPRQQKLGPGPQQQTALPQDAAQDRRTTVSQKKHHPGQASMTVAVRNTAPGLETYSLSHSSLPSLGHVDIYTRYPQQTPVQASFSELEAARRRSVEINVGPPGMASEPPSHDHVSPKIQTLEEPVRHQRQPGQIQRTNSGSHQRTSYGHAPVNISPASIPEMGSTRALQEQPFSAHAFMNQKPPFSKASYPSNQAQIHQHSTDMATSGRRHPPDHSLQQVGPASSHPPSLGTPPMAQANHDVQYMHQPSSHVHHIADRQATRSPTHAQSPTTGQYPGHSFAQSPPKFPSGYEEGLRQHLQHTKLRICVNNTPDTEIVRLGDCRSTHDFMKMILDTGRVEPGEVEKLRITFDWMQEGKKGRKFVMRLDDQADGFGHIYDEIHTRFRNVGYSVTVVDVDVLLRS